MVTIIDALWVDSAMGDVPVLWAGFGSTSGLVTRPFFVLAGSSVGATPPRRSRSETEILPSITLATHTQIVPGHVAAEADLL